MCVCLTSPTGGGLLGHVVTVLYKPMLVAVVALVRVVIVGHKPMLKASVAVLRVVTVVSDPLRTRRQLYFASHFGRQAGPSGPTLAAPGLRIVVCWSAWSRWDMSRPCIGLCVVNAFQASSATASHYFRWSGWSRGRTSFLK